MIPYPTAVRKPFAEPGFCNVFENVAETMAAAEAPAPENARFPLLFPV